MTARSALARTWVARGGVAAVLALTLLPPRQAAAQTTPRPSASPALRYGKWGAAALAAGLTGLGLRAHRDADAAFRDLILYCQSTGCSVDGTGRYADAAAEARYHDVRTGDRTARAWFLGGQAMLAGAVIMFVMELRHDDREPRNIPYSGLIWEPGARGSRFGVRIPLP